MFLTTIVDRGATPAIVQSLAYNEARLQMIAENVANIQTPGYRTKQLDARAFQHALRKALDIRGSDVDQPLVVKVKGEVATERSGRLQVTPTETPVENVLFHDGTNASIERQMADLAETGMTHDLLTMLLRGRFDGLKKAIRGVVS